MVMNVELKIFICMQFRNVVPLFPVGRGVCRAFIEELNTLSMKMVKKSCLRITTVKSLRFY